MELFANKRETAAKKVAKRLDVAWPPVYWATFKSPRVGPRQLAVLLITEEQIVWGRTRVALASARATIDASQTTAAGPASLIRGWQDNRHLLITVRSDQEMVIEISLAEEGLARQIAAKINKLGADLPSVPAVDASAGHDLDIPAQLRDLAELRDRGIVTSEEFEAQKAELLKRR
jgi:hypothetical protein